jgi:serine/threonine protein phosphatase PrpC
LVLDEGGGAAAVAVGKRAWTADELRERRRPSEPSSREGCDGEEAASRCRAFFETERHCLEKMAGTGERHHPGLPRYRGTVRDEFDRPWMVFGAHLRRSPPREGPDDPEFPTPVPSLKDLFERDLRDRRLATGDARRRRRHHLHFTSRALLPGSSDVGDASLTETLDVALAQLLDVLSHVHSRDVVHRDVKPGNLLASEAGRLVLIDFGSAADLSTAGPLGRNVGLSPDAVAVSPVYAAPELFVNANSKREAVNFDVFSAGLLYCQMLFQYLDERTESGFHQQLGLAEYSLDAWLQQALQSKVRPVGLFDALDVLLDRPGLWKLLQDMLAKDPHRRVSSAAAVKRWRRILDSSRGEDGEALAALRLQDGPYLAEVLASLEQCNLPPNIWPLHFVATFERSRSLGLYLAEADASTEDVSEADLVKWKRAVADSVPGEVFVQGTVTGGQADELGIFEVGDRLQGIGELPLAAAGFEKAVEMIQDQPRSAKYVTLHFDRRSALNDESGTVALPFPADAGPVQISDQGAWSSTGKRKAQEDAFILHEFHDAKERSVLLAGVFDGHLGTPASHFVRDELPERFSELLLQRQGMNTVEILEQAWEQTCDAYRASCQSEAEECDADYDIREGILMANTGGDGVVAGTTACVLALDKQTSRFAVLNCGDSRGVVASSEGRLYFQTLDHTPESEIDRLTRGREKGLDYSVPECSFARWKVAVGDYDYAVARSLEGRFATSKGIVSTPDVHIVQVEPGMTALVATDGFWEVIDSEEASRIVAKLRGQNMSAGDAAKKLCKLALEKGSSDNVSVVALFLD